MTNNERELLDIIRQQDDSLRALDIAIELMIDFSKKHEVPQDTSFVHPRESA